MFDQKDIQQMESLGIGMSAIEKQLQNFRNGFPFADLVRAATPGDGIIVLSEHKVREYEHIFDSKIAEEEVIKFVPASGAASRMFKKLYELLADPLPPDKVSGILDEQGPESAGYLFTHLSKAGFYRALEEKAIAEGTSVAELLRRRDLKAIVRLILEEPGLNYGNLPKGLILFHDYPDGARTAAEEHLVEAIRYARSREGKACVHFTISPEHESKFNALFDRVLPGLKNRCHEGISVGHSFQRPDTDTIAVDLDNRPFRNPDGSLLFRPGGHGALIQNLNRLNASVVFVKNIDNVVPDRLKEPTYQYKKALGGYLLDLKEKIFSFLYKAEAGKVTVTELDYMASYTREHLSVVLPVQFDDLPADEKLSVLVARLNRPLRVCGMVKNVGEPGGGPFWVRDSRGRVSLQIIESAQIDTRDPKQKKIMDHATHFNPVDLVCYIRDYKGRPFDLPGYVDESTGFISVKSSGGRDLKAQELPGLWNGAMADWVTLFIEVPGITFNPVKTVNDLLRPEHLA